MAAQPALNLPPAYLRCWIKSSGAGTGALARSSPASIDGEDGPTLLALHYVGGVPREPRGADEDKSLLRPRQVQRVRWH